MASTETQQGGAQLGNQPLISVAPSIFVPITTDLAAPLDDKPKNNVQRIEQTMRNIDAHTAKVKANIIQIMTQEKQALMREAKEEERAHPESAQVPAGISEEEYDAIVMRLETAPVPGNDPNLQEIPYPDFFGRGPPATLREHFSWRVQDLVEQAVHQVEAYGKHMESIQDEYQRALQAEIRGRTEKESEG
ncbi:uncharacterized protein DNG_08424 [Cephalotrichum gorgonifer]|uniref:Uncharacterized protein n=1 Tax=Cephalotrichum gorgonifer TaxID=2041049 RepID=A0AAE8N4A6_9PEZI|nr:uncharacterized protein DNG_08424 [Cephalotrichum gorgonifer]